MIIGNGLIATAFEDHYKEDVIFFASGVSNSLETRASEFEREKNLIQKTIQENPHKLFIYFSTCSIYDSTKSNSPYVNHKLEMEQIIEKLPNYLIFRVSNAVGSTGNPNTLLNYLVKSIKEKRLITIHSKATRNLIDVADIQRITLHFVQNQSRNKIINLAYPENYTIPEIITQIENIKNNIFNKLFRAVDEIEKPFFPDQCILNSVLANNGGVTFIDYKYNFTRRFRIGLKYLILKKFSRKKDFFIYHFVGNNKPWNFQNYDNTLFYNYAVKSPFFYEICAENNIKLSFARKFILKYFL